VPAVRRGLTIALALAAAVVVTASAAAVAGGNHDGGPDTDGPLQFEARSLDGSGNNVDHPSWGKVDAQYRRVAPADYADEVAAMNDGPSPRYVSNRVFNDVNQNVFSENGVTQWSWAWGQFLDHTFGLRETDGGEEEPLAFDPDDPLEEFENELGVIDFARTPAAPGTGVDSPREQVNTVSSYIDAWAVYGGTEERLEWLREGPVNGDLSDNGARLRLDRGEFLPRADARGDAAAAPEMELAGRLQMTPESAVVAGDVRANENVALTSLHTLFAREHNRIVDALPESLSEQQKFEVARRVVGAEQQWITYTEFLPALGVDLAEYEGYDDTVDATLSNEFAAAGYRAHSMIHGEIEMPADGDRYTEAELAAFEEQGIEVVTEGDEVELVVPINVAFANPDLLEAIGLEPVLAGLGAEPQYRNDEQIDNQLRSVLFQVPGPGVTDPAACFEGDWLSECFSGVVDLGAIDIQRGRDHGIPSYNELREAYGLEPAESFTDVTGESTDEYPAGIDADDPDSLDFVELEDADGEPVEPDAAADEEPAGDEEADEETEEEETEEARAVTAERRTTLAARLRAIYGSVDDIDAFVGIIAEPHQPGSDLGELQGAIWVEQFERLRDGDRFFYGNDPVLDEIYDRYGVNYQRTLAEIIAMNTDLATLDVPIDVFVPGEDTDIEASD
jgi:hypothetical protein